VLLLPFHHPVGLAKRLATIDVLSTGRMRLLTIRVGTLPGEAAAVGVDYATRAAGPTRRRFFHGGRLTPARTPNPRSRNQPTLRETQGGSCPTVQRRHSLPAVA
jgi:hypothetical protein